MKKHFSFNLGNRGLFPEEVQRIEAHNLILQSSAAKLGRCLTERALIVVKEVVIGEHRIYRAASKGQEPKDLPLASRARQR